jgi:hypothetical protein
MAAKIAEKAKIMEIAAKIKDENGKGTKIAIEIIEPQKRIKKKIAKNHSFLDISALIIISRRITRLQGLFCPE